MDPICEAEKRLGLSWVNIALHGKKCHPGRMTTDSLALVLFDRPTTRGSMAALWNIEKGEAVTSMELDFPLGTLWDWDWRAEQVREAFEKLVPGTYGNENEGTPPQP